ncbi:MAG: glycoside hydrolase family 38 [Chloroflexi bacterium]|nr:glycoside hydrolase family 38 [Chloroflexota bacterium]MCL5274888.1 glycoside hydrolase family 38 [Chloroflexota bacterium]
MTQLTFHLIGNAHLDPVWVWDWREGLNEGITTSRAILDLMDEDGELTFIRGEAVQYEHMEKHAPDVFERVRAYVKAGRWDVVGGTYLQPDTNMPATETLLRHFMLSQDYFESRFGLRARIAWAADSFGHSAGLPEVLAAAGMQGFAFTRPGPDLLPIAKPAFWWEGSGGSRVMAYRPLAGWYGNEHDEMPRRLNGLLAAAQQCDLQNVGVFYGLGNHGGGPSRRSLADIRAWAHAHPEVRVVFSGLHRLFDALYEEVAQHGDDLLPTQRGELNFCLRGCYSSVAKLKYFYRRTEAGMARAERTDSMVRAALDLPGAAPLDGAWTSLAFNSFHDILPGSIIERAVDDQIAWLGGAYHQAQDVENTALVKLADRIDTRVKRARGDHPTAVSLLAWNPHPVAYDGPVELDATLDYRPIWQYLKRSDELPVELRDQAGRQLPMQVVATEHTAMPEFPWRKKLVTRLSLPPFGWKVLTMGWVEGAQTPATPEPARATQHGVIDNGIYRVVAREGHEGVQVYHRGHSLFGSLGMHLVTVNDPYGSWGSMTELPESLDLSAVIASWRIAQVVTLEDGPERAMLWVRFEGGHSRLDMRLSLARQREAVDVDVRLFLNERSARVKLVLPCGARQAEYDVAGGRVTRGEVGENPGGRWVRTPMVGFASNALYNFDLKNGALRATLARASRYACDLTLSAEAQPWIAAVDSGELRFKFLLGPGDERLPILARQLEEPPVVMAVPPSPGDLPRTGSLLQLQPDCLRILSFRSQGEGAYLLCLQEMNGQTVTPRMKWLGQPLKLSKLAGGKIASWRITRQAAGWQADCVI